MHSIHAYICKHTNDQNESIHANIHAYSSSLCDSSFVILKCKLNNSGANRYVYMLLKNRNEYRYRKNIKYTIMVKRIIITTA